MGIAAVEIRRCGSLRFRLRCPRGQRSSPRLSRRSGPALMSRRASRRLSPRSRNARGKRASARADATPSELALSASASACGSPDAGLWEQPASRRRCISMVSADLVPFWRRDGIHAGTGSRLAEAKARGAEAVRIAPVGARDLRTPFVRRRYPIVPHPGASSAPCATRSLVDRLCERLPLSALALATERIVASAPARPGCRANEGRRHGGSRCPRQHKSRSVDAPGSDSCMWPTTLLLRAT